MNHFFYGSWWSNVWLVGNHFLLFLDYYTIPVEVFLDYYTIPIEVFLDYYTIPIEVFLDYYTLYCKLCVEVKHYIIESHMFHNSVVRIIQPKIWRMTITTSKTLLRVATCLWPGNRLLWVLMYPLLGQTNKQITNNTEVNIKTQMGQLIKLWTQTLCLSYLKVLLLFKC